MRKTVKHKVYTIEEKNEIVKEYLNGQTSRINIRRKYEISGDSVLHRWIKQYRENGTVLDGRGGSKGGGRPKKLKPEEMSKEELIEYVKAVEDIKKLTVFLKKQKKNIK